MPCQGTEQRGPLGSIQLYRRTHPHSADPLEPECLESPPDSLPCFKSFTLYPLERRSSPSRLTFSALAHFRLILGLENADQLARVFRNGLEESGHDWNRVEPEERQNVILQVMNQIPCFWVWDNVEAIEPATGESEWSEIERDELTHFLRMARQSQAKFLLVTTPAAHRWLGVMPRRVSIAGLPPCESLQLARSLIEHAGGQIEDGDDWRPLLDYSEGDLPPKYGPVGMRGIGVGGPRSRAALRGASPS